MMQSQRIWLVVNAGSGSNDGEAQAHLEQCCGRCGFLVERVVRFPDEPLPDGRALETAGIGLVAVFAGDGTSNALVRRLAGWTGRVLVLPGGTMNLLYRRLHGERDMDEVIRLAAWGKARAVRPGVIECRQGVALADFLAGPGTTWYDVREAMRGADVLGAAQGAAQALSSTLAAPGIVCRNPALGIPEGYPLVMLTPTGGGIRISGYHAETPGEFVEQSWAVLRRRFREGPHDDLGLAGEIALASTDGAPFGILLDGEKAEAAAEEVFRLVACAVDLLATEPDA
jgi:hypothetical protein